MSTLTMILLFSAVTVFGAIAVMKSNIRWSDHIALSIGLVWSGLVSGGVAGGWLYFTRIWPDGAEEAQVFHHLAAAGITGLALFSPFGMGAVVMLLARHCRLRRLQVGGVDPDGCRDNPRRG